MPLAVRQVRLVHSSRFSCSMRIHHSGLPTCVGPLTGVNSSLHSCPLASAPSPAGGLGGSRRAGVLASMGGPAPVTRAHMYKCMCAPGADANLPLA